MEKLVKIISAIHNFISPLVVKVGIYDLGDVAVSEIKKVGLKRIRLEVKIPLFIGEGEIKDKTRDLKRALEKEFGKGGYRAQKLYWADDLLMSSIVTITK